MYFGVGNFSWFSKNTFIIEMLKLIKCEKVAKIVQLQAWKSIISRQNILPVVKKRVNSLLNSWKKTCFVYCCMTVKRLFFMGKWHFLLFSLDWDYFLAISRLAELSNWFLNEYTTNTFLAIRKRRKFSFVQRRQFQTSIFWMLCIILCAL